MLRRLIPPGKAFSTLLVYAVLVAGTGGFVASAAGNELTRSCRLLLAKNLELDYLRAETTASRIAAREKFFDFIRENRARGDAQVSTDGLSAAWWRIALERKSAPMAFPAQMEIDELRSLLEGTQSELYLRSLNDAYRLSEVRMRAGIYFDRVGKAIVGGLKKTGRWITDAANTVYEILPNSLRARAEAILERGRANRAVRTTKKIISAPFDAAAWVIKNAGKASQYIRVAPSVSNAARARTISLYAALKLRSMLITGVDLISPIHLRTLFPEEWLERTAGIFKKLEKDPHFIPDAEDLAVLRRYGAEDAFARRQAALIAHPSYFKALRYADIGYRWAIVGLAAGAVGIGVLQAIDSDGAVSLEDFLTDPEYAPGENQVQLISETLPFPHLAIRIGNRVYSYGMTHMTAASIETYMHSHQPNGDGSGGFFARERSVQVVTLSLGSPEEADKLRRYLTFQENKEYKNVTLANDCASMVARALNSQTSISIPSEIDPSPSSIVGYFSMQRIFTEKNPVASVRLVLGSKSQDPTLQLLRNAFVNAREARLYYSPLGYALSQGTRKVIDSKSKEYIQHFDAAFIEREKARRDNVEAEIQADEKLKYLLDHRESLVSDPGLKGATREFFDRVYEEELSSVEEGKSELETILGSLYKLEYYSRAEEKILGSRSFDLKKSLKDDPEFFRETQELLSSLQMQKPAK